MKKTFAFALTLIALFISLNIKAQDKGLYRQKFTEGNLLVLENNYPVALKNYLEAYMIDSMNANINYKVGMCYIHSISEKKKATIYLERATLKVSKRYLDFEATEKNAPYDAYLQLGIAYHLEGKFDKAIENFEKYKTYLSSHQKKDLAEVIRRIEWCNNAKELIVAAGNINIVNLGDSINTEFPEYGPVISADENTIIFTSRRKEGNTSGELVGIDGQYFEDIFVSYKNAEGKWTKPKALGPNVNSINNEASIALSADAQQLLIYKDDNGGDIYVSTLDGDNWTPSTKMGAGSEITDINTKSWEPSACLTRDGNTLYFVSDRKGGIGGRDIWRAVKLPNGKWSKATNLGRPINTEYDEDAPFIHPDEVTLYFSSNGHKTMGGFDIFSSQYNEEKGWAEPTNIGYPINTTDDDVFFVTSPDGKRGYFCSDREGGRGEKDIYLANLGGAESKPLTLLKGTIAPRKGEELPMDLQIVVTNLGTGAEEGIYKPLRRNGSFAIILAPSNKYKFSYQANGAEFYTDEIEVPAGSEYNEILKSLSLEPVVISGPKETPLEKNPNESVKGPVELVTINEKLTDKNNKPVVNAKIMVFDKRSGQLLADKLTSDKNGAYSFKAKNGSTVEIAIDHDDKIVTQYLTINAKKGHKTFDAIAKVSDLKASNQNVKLNVFNKKEWVKNDYDFYQIELTVPAITSEIFTDGTVLCYISNDESGIAWTALPTSTPEPINMSSSTKSLTITALKKSATPPAPINIKVVILNSQLPKGFNSGDYNQVKTYFKLDN